MSSSLDLTLRLLERKRLDSDAFTLTLLGMMAVAAQTYEAGGFARGYVSFRSHAEYYFAAYDRGSQIRSRFDQLDGRLGGQADLLVRAVLDGRFGELVLDPALVEILADWQACIGATAQENRRIVRDNYETLKADTTFDRLVERVTSETPAAFQQATQGREMSEIGVAFQQDEGLRIVNSPEFMAYRHNVNFFYLLLPILGVSPTQKFCLCHLLANSAERVLGISWRDIMGLTEQRQVEFTE